jgi:hypothetical protein
MSGAFMVCAAPDTNAAPTIAAKIPLAENDMPGSGFYSYSILGKMFICLDGIATIFATTHFTKLERDVVK